MSVQLSKNEKPALQWKKKKLSSAAKKLNVKIFGYWAKHTVLSTIPSLKTPQPTLGRVTSIKIDYLLN